MVGLLSPPPFAFDMYSTYVFHAQQETTAAAAPFYLKRGLYRIKDDPKDCEFRCSSSIKPFHTLCELNSIVFGLAIFEIYLSNK
jgi:hypothetical protein